MTNNKQLASIAISGALALGTLGVTHDAAAQAAVPDYKYEKCFGIAKAGKNDCQTSTSSCAGTSATDGQKDAWVYLPTGTCEKITGAMKAPTG